MREVVAVAQATGVELDASDVDQQIAWTERATAVRTSMMVDRERGRAMETDAIIGVVVRRGREQGIRTPYSEALLALLTAMDAEPAATATKTWVPPP